MKKKFFMAAALTVAAVSGAIYGYLAQNASGDSDMLLANAEALTRDEASGNSVTCYNEFDVCEGHEVYDCGPCRIRLNRTGSNSPSSCEYRGL